MSTISKKCYEKLADEFRYLKAQTVEPLSTFMDFIAREKMIDNVCMIIQGLGTGPECSVLFYFFCSFRFLIFFFAHSSTLDTLA